MSSITFLERRMREIVQAMPLSEGVVPDFMVIVGSLCNRLPAPRLKLVDQGSLRADWSHREGHLILVFNGDGRVEIEGDGRFSLFEARRKLDSLLC